MNLHFNEKGKYIGTTKPKPTKYQMSLLFSLLLLLLYPMRNLINALCIISTLLTYCYIN